jgi:hypothetical protein
MEIEDGKDEIDLGFLLIHVLYMVLPCGYIDLMGAYRIERKHNGVNKMIVWGPNKHYLIYSLIMNKTWQNQ